MKTFLYVLLLALLVFQFRIGLALPLSFDHISIDGQKLFRDSEDSNLYYLSPLKLEVSYGSPKSNAPKLISIISPNEKWNFFEVTLTEVLPDQGLELKLRNRTANKKAYFKSLTPSKMEYLVINGLTKQTKANRIIGQIIRQSNNNINVRFRMDEYSMELMEEITVNKSAAGVFRIELEYEAIMINEVNKGDIELKNYNFYSAGYQKPQDSIAAQNSLRFQNKIDELEGKMIRYDTISKIVFKQVLRLDEVFNSEKIVKEVKIANENETIPIWSSVHIFCRDFIEKTRVDLLKKIVNICATGAEGKPVCEQIAFSNKNKSYSQVVIFPVPLNIMENIWYDVTEIYQNGAFVRKNHKTVTGLNPERIDVSSSEAEIRFEKVDFLLAAEAILDTNNVKSLGIEIVSLFQGDTVRVSFDIEQNAEAIIERIQFNKDKGKQVLIKADWMMSDQRRLHQAIVHTDQAYHFLSPENAEE